MRLLAIDAGNSRIKWGLHENGRWTTREAVPTADASGLEALFAQLAAPERILATNVAGDAAAVHIERAVARFGMRMQWVVSRGFQCGVHSSYAQPGQLGPDRWAALIAARGLYDGPCVVVNAGTTMTVDALSGEGIFLGGFIVPGYALMRESLARNTAGLPLQTGGLHFFPDNTGDAIASGAANALAGAMDRMVHYMRDSGEGDALILLSGGDAPMLAPMMSTRVEVVDNLVLEGIVRIGVTDV